jgi:hypothetical protein
LIVGNALKVYDKDFSLLYFDLATDAGEQHPLAVTASPAFGIGRAALGKMARRSEALGETLGRSTGSRQLSPEAVNQLRALGYVH